MSPYDLARLTARARWATRSLCWRYAVRDWWAL